jgi:tetratricopeptide (TPR) repeat protein
MSQNPIRQAVRTRRWARSLIAAAACILAVGLSSGCQEFSARKKAREAKKEYESSRFDKAAALYEEALEVLPENPTLHHNIGLCYYKLFKQGDMSPENKAIADKATQNLSKYLETNPKDSKIIDMMTGIWVDSGQYKKAIAYWLDQLDKSPKDTVIIQTLANITRQSGDWKGAIKWHYKQAEAEERPEDKVEAYTLIANLALNKLIGNNETFGVERVEIADIGIAAMQAAGEVMPENFKVESYLASLFQLRSLSHGASWAHLTDQASSQYHAKRRDKIAEEQQKQQDAAAPDGAGQPPQNPGGG